MTRIIVKNLPNSVTSQKVRETFSQKGQVTDVQLKYDEKGNFRHFGYIGFKTDDEAEAALGYFNNTFFGSCKIQVERCLNLGEIKKKHRKEDTFSTPIAIEETKKKKPSKADKTSDNVDPEFAEFLQVHSKRQKDKSIWDNDGIDGSTIKPKNATEADEEEQTNTVAHNKELSDLQYLKSKVVAGSEEKEGQKIVKGPIQKEKVKTEYFTLKVRGFPCKSSKKDIRDFFAPLKLDSIRLPPKVKGIAYIGFSSKKEWKKALDKHRSFYAGHRICVAVYEKNVPTSEETPIKGKKEQWIQQENDLKKEETIAESGRIFIRNLSYSTNEGELEALFSPFGALAEIHLPIDKHSRKIKGFAFVSYVFPENAVNAYTALDGTVFQGRMLHLIAGKSKPSDAETADGEGKSYKQKKLKEQKAQASSAHNWNTLFLGTNAVATLMAERYGTTKQQVLLEGEDQHKNQSVAVRLALGETQIVAETKQFLVENGIFLDAFKDAPKERSKTVILVKNLDAQTNTDELRDLFSPHGELGRVLLPPRGVTAIIEFLEPSEAKTAFRKLAYSKFRHMPLYLEWAPVNVFRSAADAKAGSLNRKQETAGTSKTDTQISAEEEQPEPDTTLFVKNLNFCTTDETLLQHFQNCGRVFSAVVAKKKDPKKPGETLSMGYGFVQFWHKKSTVEALKELQNSDLDGHTIELKRSNRTDDKNATIATSRKTSSAATKEPISSKLLIRNVPFEAKTHEIAELFKPFGELKSVRMPKKSTGSHRGFAFVEFLTKQDAKRAFESLSASTHFYGRRLVLEWAADEDTIEDIRRRTTSHYVDEPPTKRNRGEVLGGSPDSD